MRFPEFSGDWSVYLGDQIFDQINDRNHNSDLPILAITQEYGAIPRSDIDYHVSATEASIDSYKVVNVGDFIISLRSFQGGLEYSNYKGICSPAYVILRNRRNDSQDYLKHYLKTERFIKNLTRNIEGLRDGKMISYKQFSELEIPLPNLDEQTRIAACLSSLDALIDAQGQKLKALQEHKRGLMQKLFPIEGKRVPELRFPEFAGGREWEKSVIGEIALIASGGTPSRSRKEYWGGTIPWVTTSLIDFNNITRTDEYITEKGMKDSSAKVFPKNTVLMAMYGQGKTRGKVAILHIDASTNQACAAIIAKPHINHYFLFQNLAGRYDEIRKISNAGGQENLSAGLIEEIAFDYTDIPEQMRIVSCLSSLDALADAQRDKIVELKNFKRGLMQRLFPTPSEKE